MSQISCDGNQHKTGLLAQAGQTNVQFFLFLLGGHLWTGTMLCVSLNSPASSYWPHFRASHCYRLWRCNLRPQLHGDVPLLGPKCPPSSGCVQAQTAFLFPNRELCTRCIYYDWERKEGQNPSINETLETKSSFFSCKAYRKIRDHAQSVCMLRWFLSILLLHSLAEFHPVKSLKE